MKLRILTIFITLTSTLVFANTETNRGLNNVVFKEQFREASRGSVIAQKNIGAYYYFGHDGVPQDYKKSFEWFEKAAKEDNQQSQEMLAYMYSMGLYVKKDSDLSLLWQKKSIATEKRIKEYRENCVKFRSNIGCLAQIENLKSWNNQSLAFEQNFKKAKGGNSIAQYLVSRAYLYGEGVNVDSGKSIEWIMKSAYNKNSLAAYNLATLFFLTKGVNSDFLEFMEIAEKEKDEDALLIMKLIRLDDRNYHLENYAPITEMIRPFMLLKY